MEIQQTPWYSEYLRSLNWHIERVDGVNLFFKKLPIIGGLAKVQRPDKLPPAAALVSLLKKYHVRTVAIEPSLEQDEKLLSAWCNQLAQHVRFNKSPFLPTKTIRINLTPTAETIFRDFTEAKRRAVRRALKYEVGVGGSDDIETFIKVKNASAGFLGFITTYGLRNLWRIAPSQNRAILLASKKSDRSHFLGGVLLLFWDSIAYYWIAGATRRGKKMFAPTLLAWEAIKLSKKKKCRWFDFVGVWDERLPAENRSWTGFTKFKEGFAGQSLYYPLIEVNKLLSK